MEQKEIPVTKTLVSPSKTTPRTAIKRQASTSPTKISAPVTVSKPFQSKTDVSGSPPTKKMREIKLATPTIQQVLKKSPSSSFPAVIKKSIVSQNKKPKILNSMVLKSPKILNINAQNARKTAMPEPILKRNEDGNIEIVTEMPMPIGDNDNSELDPYKVAPTVQTNVFPCNYCERSFPLKQLLDIHEKNHTRHRDFQCAKCEKAFFSKYDLGKHMSIHTGEKPFKCVVCSKSFSRSTLLYRHEKIHVDEPKFLCGFCDKSFLSNDELERHTENHKKNRPFSCNICGKSFAFKQGMERHQVQHEKDQPYPCEYCELSFMSSSKLARHLTAHAGIRPYPCKLCPKSFLMSHHLTRHLRGHNVGIIEYKCYDCGMVFNDSDDLVYHSAIHATKSLSCPLCKKQFSGVESVTEHIKLHSDMAQSPCDYCDLIFISSSDLEDHCKVEHFEDFQGNELLIKIEKLTQTSTNNRAEIKLTTSNSSSNSEEYVIEEVNQVRKRGRPPISKKGKQSIIQQGRTIPAVDESNERNDNIEILAEFELPREENKLLNNQMIACDKSNFDVDGEIAMSNVFDTHNNEELLSNDNFNYHNEDDDENQIDNNEEIETIEQAVSEEGNYEDEFEGFEICEIENDTIIKKEIIEPDVPLNKSKRSLSKSSEMLEEMSSPLKTKKLSSYDKKSPVKKSPPKEILKKEAVQKVTLPKNIPRKEATSTEVTQSKAVPRKDSTDLQIAPKVPNVIKKPLSDDNTTKKSSIESLNTIANSDATVNSNIKPSGSQQGKITNFFKNNNIKTVVTKPDKPQVADVIKNLPKGVTIVKKEQVKDEKKTPKVNEPSKNVLDVNNDVEISIKKHATNIKSPKQTTAESSTQNQLRVSSESTPVLKSSGENKPDSKQSPKDKITTPSKTQLTEVVKKEQVHDKTLSKQDIDNKVNESPQVIKKQIQPKGLHVSNIIQKKIETTKLQNPQPNSSTSAEKLIEPRKKLLTTMTPPSPAIQRKSASDIVSSSIVQRKSSDITSTPSTPPMLKKLNGPTTSTPIVKSQQTSKLQQQSKPVTSIASPNVQHQQMKPQKQSIQTLAMPKSLQTTSQPINKKQISAPLTSPTSSQLSQLKMPSKLQQQLPAGANSSFCEMKIGDRVVKVQKLRMTKDQLDQMKKEGKIEMSGNTLIMKRPADQSSKLLSEVKSEH